MGHSQCPQSPVKPRKLPSQARGAGAKSAIGQALMSDDGISWKRLDLPSILELGELRMGGAREWAHVEVNAARAAAPHVAPS